MARLLAFMLAVLVLGGFLLSCLLGWLQNTIGTQANASPSAVETIAAPPRALGDYQRIRDNGIRAARKRLAQASATFLERIGYLDGDLANSRKEEQRWVRNHIDSPEGLPRFTKPDEVDLYEYWMRLHRAKQNYQQALERFELECVEIDNRFSKGVEGIDLRAANLTPVSQISANNTDEKLVRMAQISYRQWNRNQFDNFACFQAAYR